MVTARRGKNIAKADAARYIAGYTIWNDWSARDQQMREAPVGMGPSKGKDFDPAMPLDRFSSHPTKWMSRTRA